MARRTAVFHERERMQQAVRELATLGVPRDQILVAPTGGPDPAMEPRSLLGMTSGLLYAGIGGAFGALAGVAMSGAPGSETLTTIWMVIVGALLGAMIGALVGIAVGAARNERWRTRATVRSWAVRVDASDAAVADRAAETLERHGGALLS